MKYSTQPITASLERDFGPEWSNGLSITIDFTPEMVIIEQEAWKDQVNLRSGAPDTPRPVDPWGLMNQENDNDGEKEKEEEEATEEDDLAYTHSHYWLGEEYDLQHWALVRYNPNRQDIRYGNGLHLELGWDTQGVGKKIMLYVFLAVLLHGIWTHRNESNKSDACSCHCPPRALEHTGGIPM
jgi:hypothetical protein